MSFPLAAFSASVALTMACWAAPLASAAPALAACVSWFTSSIRTSLRFTRSWVFSTSPERVSTLALTSPTSLPTYFLVAQPEPATPTISNTGMIGLIGPPFIVVSFSGRRAECPGYGSGLRHVAAARLDRNALARGGDLDPPEPVRPGGRIISQTVLVLELAHDHVGGLLQPAEIADHEGGAAGHLGIASQHRAAHGGGGAALASRELLGARVVQRRDDRDRVDRDVERPRAGDHVLRLLGAGGVDAVGDHHHRPAAFPVRGEVGGGMAQRVMERGGAEGLHLGEAAKDLGVVGRERHDPEVVMVEAGERDLVARVQRVQELPSRHDR